ncbi:MAG: rhodanese-like domain-containing protein [Opitutus sp.]|nr:rhodanese-like domain-containing protein [Opitutus sp.]MCS6246158.1 rhodanese-like domain-containing protein [Opitutus sp.]MCS6272996.1 rhodanese-like domain-containing protein [Opitutus sp.]MCS6278497.1 rhodanese-like domain-containing protein [Opitutus sp.]MCS6300100.1 rhodanese-like domain-containing protein [Opitutus sp.]
MKTFLLIALVIVVFFFVQRALVGPILTPEEAARRVAAGTAVLIDVREPAEWRDGVVKGALLLPLSDLQGDRLQWKPVLAANADKELILYCRSGNRSGIAVRLLAGEKFKTANAGGFSAWKAAGQPVVIPK